MDDDRSVRNPSFVSSALATWGSQLAVAVLSLANVLIVARALGATGRGDVAFLTTVAYLTSQLALLGVEQANINLASAEPRLRRALATNSVVLAVLLGALAVGVVGGLVAIFPHVGSSSAHALTRCCTRRRCTSSIASGETATSFRAARLHSRRANKICRASKHSRA